MLHEWIRVWFGWVGEWGYAGVFGLMALESSIVPVPSEIVMPPAAFWAAQGRGEFWLVVLAGTAGSYAGSIINYGLAKWLGTPVLVRYGRWFGLSHDKLESTEGMVRRYGAPGVFLSRFLPVVRHLISIPAGALQMPVARFSAATIAGAGLWCLILSWLGREVLGSRPELLQSPEMMMMVLKERLHWFVASAIAFTILYAVMVWLRRRSLASHSALAV